MTKFHVKTNSSSYLHDKDVFIKELKHFHEVRGSAIRHIPVINGKEVDLYLLYMMVTHHGGWVKVNSQGLWDSMLKGLGLPASVVNGGVAVRQLYLRHLERWERARGGGPGGTNTAENDAGADEPDDDRPRRAAWGTPRPRNTIAHTYNHSQHNVPDHIRETNGLPPLLRLGGAMERLALSLLSPLPNEQDFALNVCTILAADSANKLPVQSIPHIIDFLLGHAAVYNHSSLRDVIGKSYMEARSCSMEWYWAEHVKPSGTLELLDEERFPVHGLAMRALVSQLSLSNCLASDGSIFSSDGKLKTLLQDISGWDGVEEGVLAQRCNGGARDLVSRRLLQVATIMRNLSFHEDNLTLLSKHQTFIRFTLLCVNSSMSCIRQLGLDTLGNVSQELAVKDPATCLLSRHVFSTLAAALQSEDRARVLSALEVLNKLAQNECNEDVLLRSLEQKVYKQVCSYLTLHDIMLLVVTLECVYALTTLGERACDYIVKVHGLIDTLVSLITVEAQSYGPKACILMRVVETVPGGATAAQSSSPSSAPAPTALSNAPSVGASSVPLQSLPLNSVPIAPMPLAPTHQHTLSVQQQHAHQQAIQENEQFALAWLRSAWEPCSANVRLDAAELYKQYMACCAKVGRKGVIAPLHFPRCVRSVFGGMVGPNVLKTSSGDQQCYLGIRQRPQAQSPASPILKAQLSKAELNKAQQLASHPHLSMALGEAPPPAAASPPPLSAPPQAAPAATNTTLIKHLLAHKVSPADRMHAQVTQRQNQQRMMGQSGHSQPNPQMMQSAGVTIELDAEAMISCSTITSSGVTSTSPLPVPMAKGPCVPPLAPISRNITTVRQEDLTESIIIEDQGQGGVIKIDESSTSNNNKMLADLLEKRSPPPVQIMKNEEEEFEEPAAKKARTAESVSSKAANLYAALAADALEDEEELLLVSPSQAMPPVVQVHQQVPSQTSSAPSLVQQQGITTQQPTVVVQQQGSVQQQQGSIQQQQQGMVHHQGKVQQQGVVQQQQVVMQQQQVMQQQGVIQQTVMQQLDSQDENIRQVIMPGISNQGGQIILHGGGAGKQVVTTNSQGAQFVSHSAPLQLIAAPGSHQGIQSYIQGGVMPHKTIIILQSGNSNNPPITLTVNNPGNMDENTLNNLISQASDAITQQQSLSGSQQTGNIQSGGVIQSTQAMIQTPQGMMQTTQAIVHPSGVIKQQIVQGQVIQSQQPIITQQPQSQMIATGHQIISSQPGQQVILQGQPNQIISTGNQQMIVQGNQNQQIISAGNQQMIVQGNQNQQMIVQGNQNQQMIVQGNQNQQMIVQGNQNQQMIVQGNQNQQILVQSGQQPQYGQIISSNQLGNQQIVVGNQQIVVGNQQMVIGNQQVMTGAHQIISSGQQFMSSNQQIVSVSQPFQAGNQQIISTGQQRIITSNQFIVDQQGNRQMISGNPNIIMQGQNQAMNVNQQIKHDKKIVVSSPQLMQQGQKIIVNQQQFQASQTKVVASDPPPMKLPPVSPHKVPDEPWVCQWRGCDTVFESAAAVYAHACATHCIRPELPCLWAHCDQLPRKRFSLMTHLQDRHCSAEALTTSLAQRRKGIVPSPAPTAPPPPERSDAPAPAELASHPGYAPNAALHAIKRHAVDFLNPRELMDDNEGPVTKSIRLTAALILRNIVIYSHTGRRLLRGYEPHLAGIALSSVEASRTVAQVLYDMNCI